MTKCCVYKLTPAGIRVEILSCFHYKMLKVRLFAVPVLQTALLICTVAKGIYEFLAGDSVK